MSTYHTAGGKTYTLSGSISSTATSITLTSFTEPVTGTVYTMANLNTDIAYATIAPKTTSSEFISFTGITANADGTATLTGVTRGLAKKYPYTTDSTYKLPHSGQSQFILSDAPQVFEKYVSIDNTETVAGVKTFSSTPVSSAGLPTTSTQLATKQYVDNTATGTTNINRIVVAGTAGETVAVDQLVYLKASDGRWWLADADTAATVENVTLGIAQGSGTAGNAISSGVLTYGFNTFSALTLTANTQYYASNTAGGFSSTPGTTEVTVGESQTTTTFIFDPRNNQQITEDQQDALAGSSGTPSSTNLYVTANDATRNYNTVAYAADAGASDTYVITLSPVPTAYTTGMVVKFKANTVNTGAATINVNSLGAKTIVKYVSTTLADGDIAAGMFCTLIYDGTNFVLQNPTPVVTPTTATKISASPTITTITASGESTIFSVSIPANTLSTANAIRFRTYVKLTGSGADSAQFKFKYGASTVVTGDTFNGPAASLVGLLEFTLYANGATNSQQGVFVQDLDALNSQASTEVNNAHQAGTGTGAGTSTEDSTGALTFTVTLTNSGTNNTGIFYGATVEKIF